MKHWMIVFGCWCVAAGLPLQAFAQRTPKTGKQLLHTVISRCGRNIPQKITLQQLFDSSKRAGKALAALSAATVPALPAEKLTRLSLPKAPRPGSLFQAVSPQDPNLKFSGTVFYTYYQGKKEIYGAIAAHAVSNYRGALPGIPRRFEAVFFLPQNKIKKIPAEIVAFSPTSMLDIALVKFPAKVERFLRPYPLGRLENEEMLYSFGYNHQGLLPVYNRRVLQNTPYSIRTSMPVKDKKNRSGLCGGAVLNGKKQLVGIHTGSSFALKRRPSSEPVCAYATPARYLNFLVEAYHNAGKAAVPFYLDDQHTLRLNIDEYIVSYTLLDAWGISLENETVDFHFSRSALQKQLKKFPQAKFLRIYTHQLAWNKRNTALPIYPHYETNIPKQTYLYNLRTGKQYKLPKFLSPAL